VVLTGTARDELVDALVKAGYEVHIAASVARVESLIAKNVVDAWIFDASADDVLDLLLGTRSFLLPADNIPTTVDRRSYSHWVERLMTQLEAALLSRAGGGRTGRVNRWGDVQGVWLLAGSAGATSAIQAFLNAFKQPPPVAFIYAQHLDPAQRHQLQSFTVQNTQFSLCISEGVQALAPAQLVMISPRCKVALNKFGQMTSTREAWEGEHTPDINEMLVILSAAQLPSPGVIVFSGMGDDGAAALHIFEAIGGRVWVQSPDSAVCAAMPQAAIDTGLVHRSGSPEELAATLERLYSS
jgi:chemosensory pili system protein ChpB (putative protein-glutamate methylesterase)